MTAGPMHLTKQQLEAGLEAIRQSPQDEGRLELIVRRPRTNEREILDHGELDLAEGLVGDNWLKGSAHADAQLTLMNARAIALVAHEKSRWSLAGDQLYVDLDLSAANLPPGTKLEIGSAVIEVTAMPHTGCRKFSARFGRDAMKFVNSSAGKQLKLRGVNAKVVRPGEIRTGDLVRKITSGAMLAR